MRDDGGEERKRRLAYCGGQGIYVLAVRNAVEPKIVQKKMKKVSMD